MPSSEPLADLAVANQIGFVRGPEDNVIARFSQAIDQYNPDVIVRITGDNPLVDPDVIDLVVAAHMEQQADYSCASGFPIGTAVDVYSHAAMDATCKEADGTVLADHTDLHVLEQQERFHCQVVMRSEKAGQWRFTVDDADDLDRIRRLHLLLKNAGKDMERMPVSEVMDFISTSGLQQQYQPKIAAVSKENLYTAELVAKIPHRIDADTVASLHQQKV